jgi:SET domain-containing protein
MIPDLSDLLKNIRYAPTRLGSAMRVSSAPSQAEVQEAVSPGQVYVAPSELHGRGVFAGRSFAAGAVIEECPVLTVQAEQFAALDATDLYGFSFEWEDDGAALALGYGSLYNHSWSPNARYDHDYERELVVYTAVLPIAAGEEVTINYSGEPDGRADLWFDAPEP